MKAILLSLLLIMPMICPSLSHAEGKWVGRPAPGLSLPDQDGKARTLSEFRGQWVALYFYPRDKTAGCTEEALKFRERWADFRRANIMVVGASVDDVASHKAFARELKLPFPLLADTDHALAKAMGVLRGFGPMSFASRQTFLIDPTGTIVYHYPDVDTGRHAEQVLADVARLSATP